MKILKTYGLRGMIEKTVILNHKGVNLHISFTGGSANANGVVPAKYSTANPVFQAIIEGSEMYKKKWVTLLRTNIIQEPGSANEEAAKASNVSAEVGQGVREVAVSDIESDARQWLLKNCEGLKAHDLRSKSQIIQAGAHNGVRFVLKG